MPQVYVLTLAKVPKAYSPICAAGDKHLGATSQLIQVQQNLVTQLHVYHEQLSVGKNSRKPLTRL